MSTAVFIECRRVQTETLEIQLVPPLTLEQLLDRLARREAELRGDRILSCGTPPQELGHVLSRRFVDTGSRWKKSDSTPRRPRKPLTSSG